MSNSRNPRLAAVGITFSLAALIVSLPLVAGASVGNPATATVLKAAKAALAKQTGAHIVFTSQTSTKANTIVVDIGKKNSTEVVIQGKARVTIIVTPKAAYLAGNSLGLVNLMGLTKAQIKLVGTKSIVVKVGSSQYSSLHSNLSTSVFTALLPSVKGTTYSLASDGSKNYSLRWTAPASSTAAKSTTVLIISSGNLALPISEAMSSATGSGTTTFSKWGENRAVSIPAKSSTIPYTTVFAG